MKKTKLPVTKKIENKKIKALLDPKLTKKREKIWYVFYTCC